MKSFGWVGALIAFFWFVGALVTVIYRSPLSCGALISQTCGAQFLNWLGDIATFAWVKEWETLVGTLIALLAALLGAHVIRQQMKQTESIDRASTERKLEASRAVFPLTLSNGVEHARNCSEALRQFHQHIQKGDTQEIEAFTYPPLPSDLMAEFKILLEFEERHEPRAVISKLVQHIQLMQSGMRHLTSASPTRTHPTTIEIEDVCVEVCIVHGHIDMLFSYARGSNQFDFDEARSVWNAAAILSYSMDIDFQYTRDGLARRYGPQLAN